MARGPNPRKLREWTERLARFEKSQQSVGEFCSTEGVSQPSFYQWRRKLAAAARPKTRSAGRRLPPGTEASPSFQSVVLTTPQQGEASEARIRLPGGVEIELGRDPAVIETIIAQLLQVTGGMRAC